MPVICAKGNRIKLLIFVLLIVAISIIIHAPCFKSGFILDAHYVVEKNSLIKHPELYREVLSRNMFDSFKSLRKFNLNYYRPVVTLSYILDYNIWKLNSYGYRITNLLLHIISCLLVFYLFYLLFDYIDLALLTSFFFCVLPTHEWVVNYIVGRGDLLQCVFSLISLIYLTKYLKRQKPLNLFISLSAFLLAILSREIGVLLPLFAGITCFAISKDKKRTIEITMLFTAISLVYLAIRQWLFPIGEQNVPDLIMLINWSLKTIEYLPRFVVPWSVFYLIPKNAGIFISIFTSLCFFGLAAFSILTAEEKSFKYQITFGGLWILFGTIPFIITSGLMDRLGPYLSEHFLYFASIGFSFLLSLYILKVKNIFLRNTFIFSFILFYLLINVHNGMYWKNEYALLKRIQKTENDPFSVVSRQILMRYEQDIEKINNIISNEKAPDKKGMWHLRLSQIYRSKNQYDKAFEQIKKALEYNPIDPNTYNTLAVLYFETSDTNSGFKNLFKSLEIDNTYAETYRLIGSAFYFMGNFKNAVIYLGAAHYFDPDNTETRSFLATSKEKLQE